MGWSKRTTNQGKASHGIMSARAGTGKTFTGIEGLRRMNGLKSQVVGSAQQELIWNFLAEEYAPSAMFVAFNKAIARELQEKIPLGVLASTFHSMCNSAIRKVLGNVRFNQFKVDEILDNYVVSHPKNIVLRSGIKSLVALCKATLLEPTSENLTFLMDRYGIDVNDSFYLACDTIPNVLKDCAEDTNQIDYDDMIWFIQKHEFPMEKVDLLLIDEGQDLNQLQQTVSFRAGERIVLIGDPWQSIYGFRGADIDSIPNMKHLMEKTDRGVQEFPLSISRRCPKSHVELAQKIVTDFESMEDAVEGTIQDIAIGKFNPSPGDLVICRVNAPLVSHAFRLIRNGIPAKIQGRNIGEGLLNLIKKLKASSVDHLLVALERYQERERNRILSRKRFHDSQLVALEDKCMCLQYFCDNLDNVWDVQKRITEVFSDIDHNGQLRKEVTLSSIHRAKGLEASHVYILRPELLPHPMAKRPWEQVQEKNIEYVALTRSLDTLSFVRP